MKHSFFAASVVLFSLLAWAADDSILLADGRKLKVSKGCATKGNEIRCPTGKLAWAVIDDTGFVFDAFEGAVKSVGAKIESSNDTTCKVDKGEAECKSYQVSGSTYGALPYVMIAMGKVKGKETQISVQCSSLKPFEQGMPAPCDQILSLAAAPKK